MSKAKQNRLRLAAERVSEVHKEFPSLLPDQIGYLYKQALVGWTVEDLRELAKTIRGEE